MDNNKVEQIDGDTPDGVALSVSRRMALLILAMAAMAAVSETAVAEEVTENKAAVESVLDGRALPEDKVCVEEDKLAPAGKVHSNYLERIEAIDVPVEVDIKFLRESKLSSIRYNPRLFYPKKEDETQEQEILSLKDETARRLRAYTTQDKDWYTLDLKKMGTDKKTKLSHENNIQLGDILVDTDIRTILIKRGDGTVIKAKRGVAEDGGYKGRIGFLDENKRFVPVFSDDKFRILSEKETLGGDAVFTQESYAKWNSFEDFHRSSHKQSYQTQRGSASTFTSKEDALRAAKKLTYNPDEIKVPTLEMIEEARKELKRGKSSDAIKNYYLVLGKENFMEIVKYCAAEAGVPVELILTVIKKESGFTLGIVGDHGAAIGLGQLHEPIFKFIRAKPLFAEIMAKFTNKPVNKIKRSESVLVDVLSVAMLLRNDINANKIEADMTTHLTPKQIAYIRYHYHVPGRFSGPNKEKGFNRCRGSYERFAREVLMVRKILDELSGKGIPET